MFFELQAILTQIYRRTMKWPCALHGQMYPIHVVTVHPSILTKCPIKCHHLHVTVHFNIGSQIWILFALRQIVSSHERYWAFQMCSKWRQISYNVKGTCTTYPKFANFTPVCSTTSCFWVQMHWMATRYIATLSQNLVLNCLTVSVNLMASTRKPLIADDAYYPKWGICVFRCPRRIFCLLTRKQMKAFETRPQSIYIYHFRARWNALSIIINLWKSLKTNNSDLATLWGYLNAYKCR